EQIVRADFEEVSERHQVFPRRKAATALPTRHCGLMATEPLGNVILGQAAAGSQFAQACREVACQWTRGLGTARGRLFRLFRHLNGGRWCCRSALRMHCGKWPQGTEVRQTAPT